MYKIQKHRRFNYTLPSTEPFRINLFEVHAQIPVFISESFASGIALGYGLDDMGFES
jgi:hypothetical protein